MTQPRLLALLGLLGGCGYQSSEPVEDLGDDTTLDDGDGPSSDDGGDGSSSDDGGDGELGCEVGDPSIVGSLPEPASMHKLSVLDGFAYVAAGDDGLLIVDVRDPGAPVVRGAWTGDDAIIQVVLGAGHAYVGDAEELVSVDVSDPDEPEAVGAVSPGTRVGGIGATGDHVFLANSWLSVADVTDPADPAIVDELDFGGSADGLDVSTDHAFLANGGQGLLVIDVSRPDAISFAGGLDLSIQARDVSVAHGWAFVSGIVDEVFVIDVSDPSAPTLVAQLGGFGAVLGLVVAGQHLFLADTGALQIVDVSDPTRPTLLETISMPGGVQAVDVAVTGSHAFVSTAGAGLQVVDLDRAL